MRRLEAASWVLTLCYALRLSQAKTLAAIVPSAMHCQRVSLANLGRGLTGTAAKHAIKRVWRFCDNHRVTVSDAMTGLIDQLFRRRQKKPLLIALDGTEIRAFHTLMASVVMKGRSLPLLGESYPQWHFHRSQNALEEGLLVLLRTLVPRRVPVILLADRGFGRTEMARLCQRLELHYLIRIKSDVYIDHPRYRGLLHDYLVRKGMRRILRGVRYRKDDPVTHNLVIRWKEGLLAGRDEPWFLMTDLDANAIALTDGYGKRMTIEELFRDGKNKRNGWSLRDTQVEKASRLDRLLLILALAYWLLVGIGLLAGQQYRPGRWCSSNDPHQCSAFTIGKIMVDDMQVSPAQAFAAVLAATIDILGKLGTT